jgi:hypothetical protein
MVTLLAVASCGRIGYLPELAPADAGRPPVESLDATGGGAADTTAGSPADVTTSADATQDMASLGDAFADDTATGDTGTAPDATTSGSDGSGDSATVDATTSDSATTDAATPDAATPDAATRDGEAGATFFVCDSSACCCAYECKYGTVPAASTCSTVSDTAQYGFESGTQGWVATDQNDALVPGQTIATTSQKFAGTSALQVTLNIAGGMNEYARYQSPPVAPLGGAVVTFHVWVPPGANLWAIQPYVMDKNFVWTGAWTEMTQIVQGCWSTITLTVPNNFASPAWEIGVDFSAATGVPYTGVVYVDAVEW